MTETIALPEAPRVPIRGGVVPYLQVDGALLAADLYKTAFGAEIAFAYPPDDKGRTMHVHLYINGSSVMLSDAFPEHGHPHRPAAGYSLTIMPEDIDTAFARAVAAGLEVITPLQDMFWGDRYGALRDAFGVAWAMNAPKN
jgi:uncharacterized glyoxalase superfamily protein PhnB